MDNTNDQAKQQRYERRYSEIHYRAMRAMFMNYEESKRFDKWALYTEIAAAVTVSGGIGLCGLGTQGLKLLRFKGFSRPTWTRLMSMAFATAALMEYSARSAELFPSLERRAQNHMNAGKDFARISSLAGWYSSELHAMKPDKINWEKQDSCYEDLVAAYQEASKFTVVKAKTYTKYNDVSKTTYKQYAMREKQLDDFLEFVEQRNNKL